MNADKLRDAMKAKGITVARMCKEIGISRKAFWSKCTGRTEFKQSEMVKIVEVLGVKDGAKFFFS